MRPTPIFHRCVTPLRVSDGCAEDKVHRSGGNSGCFASARVQLGSTNGRKPQDRPARPLSCDCLRKQSRHRHAYYWAAPAPAAVDRAGRLTGFRVWGATGSSVAKSEAGLSTGDGAVMKPPSDMVE